MYKYPKEVIRRVLMFWTEIEETELTTESEELVIVKCDIEMAVKQARGRVNRQVVNTLLLDGDGALACGAVTEEELLQAIDVLYDILNVEGLE